MNYGKAIKQYRGTRFSQANMGRLMGLTRGQYALKEKNNSFSAKEVNLAASILGLPIQRIRETAKSDE